MVLPIIAYIFLFNKMGRKGKIVSDWKQGAGGQEGEMTQTLYVHMNKIKEKKRNTNVRTQNWR
jgi:hypothetical protein